jgi:hypothetical protein
MKVYDRYQGSNVELPDTVEPGRYRLLAPCLLNDVISLNAGDILWDAGSQRCGLSGQQNIRSFASVAAAQIEAEDLIDEAVAAIITQTQAEILPSPVMPAKLEEFAEMTVLEQSLKELLDAGHLQTIAQRPRMDMRYDTEVLAISRVRRLAPDALTHLAAHSEDWHRRQLTGVVPARLKALVSEDEFAIYENVVFVRLVDRLQVLLSKHLRAIAILLAKQGEAKGLSDAQQLNRRLRDALCTLWGKSFADNPDAGAAAKDTFDVLKKMLGKVRQLKQSALYGAVPSTRKIPIALRNTNILQHDPHYRHLRATWLLAHSNLALEVESPQKKYEIARDKGDRYAKYVELLLRHALAASVIFTWDDAGRGATFGPWRLSLTSEHGDCFLELSKNGQQIALFGFVAGWRGSMDWAQQREDLYVFFSHPDLSVESVDAAEPGGDSVLHPLQFYAVERVRFAVEQWLLKHLLGGYPFTVAPIPSELYSEMMSCQIKGIEGIGKGIAFTTPLQQSSQAAIEKMIGSSAANPETKERLRDAMKRASLLGRCRVCGEVLAPSAFRTSDHGFKAECRCGHTWSLKMVNRRPTEATFKVGNITQKFSDVGCRQVILQWPAAEKKSR